MKYQPCSTEEDYSALASLFARSRHADELIPNTRQQERSDRFLVRFREHSGFPAYVARELHQESRSRAMGVLRNNPSEPSSPTSPGNSSGPGSILRFDRVTVYFDEQAALADVSFEIRAGETTVVSGAAGSGKTVLLKTAIGLIQPDAGRVYLFGEDITNLSEQELFPLRRRAGVLFQEGALFDSLTVEENVAFPLVNQSDRELSESEVQVRVKEALASVDLRHALEKYPSELSGGMRRRVGIARATVTHPSLMLYDSPTAGLDPITAFRIMALVIRQGVTRNTTPLVVTYRFQDSYLLANYRNDPESGKLIRALNVNTKFLVLREGRLVFEGPETEFRSSTDPYVAKFARRETTARDYEKREPRSLRA